MVRLKHALTLKKSINIFYEKGQRVIILGNH